MTEGPSGGAISVRNLTVLFSRWGQEVAAISDVSLDIASGEWVLLVGHNGAGKSTILKVLSGELPPNSGSATVGGRDVLTLTPEQLANSVFTVHQDPLRGTAPLLTVLENMAVADPRNRAVWFDSPSLLRRYAELLEPVGLAHRLRQPVKTLSGGERQLLSLVIAEIRPAPIILLDEPLAALDPTKTSASIDKIAAMHRAGKTILQVAHDIRSLRLLAGRVLTLRQGRIEVGDGETPPSHPAMGERGAAARSWEGP
jgi:putative tryptophan/tyrosine transport system ATP-binding protein